MHRYLSTDYGSECFRCGMALDYRPDPGDPDARPRTRADHARLDRMADAAHALAFALCGGPELGRAHHLVIEADPARLADPDGYILACAYGDATVTDQTLPATVALECIGA